MKKSLIGSAAILLLLVISLISACTKDEGKLPVVEVKTDTTKTSTQTNPCDTITYTKHIKPIVDKTCLSCHGDINPFGGFSLNSYDLLKAKGQSGRLAARVINGLPSFMPQGRAMSNDTTALFNCWIKNGYKN